VIGREMEVVLGAPWGRGAVLVAAVVALVSLALSARGWRRIGARALAPLLALRALGLCCALVLLLQPAVRLRRVSRPSGRVAVLVDDSRSMTVRDGDGGRSRFATALDALRAARPLIAGWRRDRAVDLSSFGETLAPLAEDAPAPPTAAATRTAEALEALAARAGDDLGGVVLISDGADNGRLAAHPPDEARVLAARLGVPVHAVWVGGPALRDVAISALRRDDFAFVRTVFTVEAEVRATGYSGEATVRLEREGEVVATRTVPLDARGRTVSFEVTPDRVGEVYYAVSVVPRPDEAVLENNRRGFVVRVVRDRIRVLHVTGRPSWDERFLRRLLKREPNVDLVSFFILRTQTDLGAANPAELSLIPFPTDELFEQQLPGFDLVILQNFAQGPFGLARHLPRIRDWVERGGGLAVIGGDLAFGAEGWAGTPVADVLPLDLPPLPTSDLRVTGEFRARLREGAEGHPAVRLASTTAATRRAWDALPTLEGTNLLGPPRDGGTVLLERPGGATGPAPLLAVREAGAGRTLLLATDSSWRWSFLDAGAGGDGGAYQSFWRSAMRWLIHDPDAENLHLDLPRDTFAPGEAIVARVRVSDRAFGPAPGVAVTLEATRLDAPAAAIRSSPPRTDPAGETRAELPSPGVGAFRLGATATINGRRSVDARTFVVEPPAAELEHPEAREDLLRLLAAESGGSFRRAGESLADLSFRPSRRVRVEAQHDVELWSGWPMLLLGLSALGAEWALRRRRGLP
jgi:putative glutamine amidotransferase